MKLTIQSLHISNFKGIKELFIDFANSDFDIFGDNATGKTTVYDAFTWLLFGKDSAGNADSNFDIKPLDKLGNILNHGATTQVTATIQYDGEPLKLTRNYKEKWTAKRGQATAEFSGNETEYFLDEVPVKKKDYDSRVAEIVDESTFRVLTDVNRFANLGKIEKREFLFKLANVESDIVLMSKDEQFTELTNAIGKYSVEDFIKKTSAERKNLSGLRDELPSKIDENISIKNSISQIDFESLKEQREAEEQNLQCLQVELSAMNTNTAELQYKTQLSDIRSKIAELELKNQEFLAEQRKNIPNICEIQEKIKTLHQNIEHSSSELDAFKKAEDKLNLQLSSKRDEWVAENAKQFDGATMCPTCGRKLEEDSIHNAMDSFNKAKTDKLANISNQATNIKEQLQEYSKMKADKQLQIEDLQSQIDKMKGQLSDAQQLDTQIANMPNYETEWQGLKAKYSELQSKLSEIENGSFVKKSHFENEIIKSRQEIKLLSDEIAKFSIIEQTTERINSLNSQAQDIAKQIEQLDKYLYLCGQFVKFKADFIENTVNSKFKYVKFKLFDTQINGAVVDCCEITVDGVPYTSLNNAAKINAGVDIINTLSEFYGITVPLFIDNAESITKICNVPAQLVRLVVSENDKKLRFERV